MNTMALQRVALAFTITAAVGLAPAGAAGQGCEPIRFTTPVNLGGIGQAYAQAGGQWQLGLSYRHLLRRFFVGSESSPEKGPGGSSRIQDSHVRRRRRLRVQRPVPPAPGRPVLHGTIGDAQCGRGPDRAERVRDRRREPHGRGVGAHAAHAPTREHCLRPRLQGADWQPHTQGRQWVPGPCGSESPARRRGLGHTAGEPGVPPDHGAIERVRDRVLHGEPQGGE